MTETRGCFMCGQKGLKQGERVLVGCVEDGVRRVVWLCQSCTSNHDPRKVFAKLDRLTRNNRISQLWP